MDTNTCTCAPRSGPPSPLLAIGAGVGLAIARGPDIGEWPAVCVDLTVVDTDGSERQLPVLLPADRADWLADMLLWALCELAAAGWIDPPAGAAGEPGGAN
jgi:hypothetical protein